MTITDRFTLRRGQGQVCLAAKFEAVGELGAKQQQTPVGAGGRRELLQNDIQQGLEIARFADRLADLIVHDHLRAQAADALAGRADHGEEHAHARHTALALHLIERRLGETEDCGASRRNRRG